MSRTAPTTATPPASTHEHGGPPVPTRPLTSSERRARAAQLDDLRRHLPGRTVADALAAGYVVTNTLEGPNDVHLTLVDQMTAPFDPSRPAQLLAAGRRPTDALLAAVYWQDGPSTTPPPGFAGPADQWHQHVGSVCQLPDPSQPTPRTPAACAAGGGRWVRFAGWMLHVWALPGESNPDGLFAAENPCVRSPGRTGCERAQSTP